MVLQDGSEAVSCYGCSVQQTCPCRHKMMDKMIDIVDGPSYYRCRHPTTHVKLGKEAIPLLRCTGLPMGPYNPWYMHACASFQATLRTV